MKNELQNVAKLAESMEYFGKAFLSMAQAFKGEIDEMSAKPTTADTPEQLPLTAQAEPKAKKERKKKEDAPAQAAAPVAPAPAQADDFDHFNETPPVTAPVQASATPAPAQAAAAPAIDEGTLRNKLVEYAQKHGKDPAYAILAKYNGAKKVNELTPDLMPKVYNELSAGL